MNFRYSKKQGVLFEPPWLSVALCFAKGEFHDLFFRVPKIHVRSVYIKILLLILSIILNFSSYASKQLTIENFKLDNGLEVVLIPNNRAPVVYHGLWYKVGSADSPHNKSGLAHFVEHLMFKGTSKYPGDSFKFIINKLGGDPYAATNWDYTTYSITIAKEYLERIMELEADRMTNLAFTQPDEAKELQVILQERRQQVEANPNQLLMEATNAALFWQHPYGKMVIGFRNHMKSYTYEDAINFYQTWYAPNNAILVLSGDVSKDTVMPLITKYYGAILSKKLPDRKVLREVEPTHNNCTTKVELRDTKLQNNYWLSVYNAPNHSTVKSFTSYTALNLLEFILGDESFGRLRKILVDQQKIAFAANADYSGDSLDPYGFSIFVSPINVIDTAKTEYLVSAEINNLLKNGITQDELTNAKQQYSIYFRFNHDSITGMAQFVGTNLANNFNLEEIKTWLNTLQNLSIKQVNDAAHLIFNKPPQVVGYAYPVMEN